MRQFGTNVAPAWLYKSNNVPADPGTPAFRLLEGRPCTHSEAYRRNGGHLQVTPFISAFARCSLQWTARARASIAIQGSGRANSTNQASDLTAPPLCGRLIPSARFAFGLWLRPDRTQDDRSVCVLDKFARRCETVQARRVLQVSNLCQNALYRARKPLGQLRKVGSKRRNDPDLRALRDAGAYRFPHSGTALQPRSCRQHSVCPTLRCPKRWPTTA